MAYGIGRWIAGHMRPSASLFPPRLGSTNGVFHTSAEPSETDTVLHNLFGSVPYSYAVGDPISMGFVAFFSPAPVGVTNLSASGAFYRVMEDALNGLNPQPTPPAMAITGWPAETIFRYSGVWVPPGPWYPFGPGEEFGYGFEFGGTPGFGGAGIHVLAFDLWVA